MQQPCFLGQSGYKEEASRRAANGDVIFIHRQSWSLCSMKANEVSWRQLGTGKLGEHRLSEQLHEKFPTNVAKGFRW